jgi:hypothetical protein
VLRVFFFFTLFYSSSLFVPHSDQESIHGVNVQYTPHKKKKKKKEKKNVEKEKYPSQLLPAGGKKSEYVSSPAEAGWYVHLTCSGVQLAIRMDH